MMKKILTEAKIILIQLTFILLSTTSGLGQSDPTGRDSLKLSDYVHKTIKYAQKNRNADTLSYIINSDNSLNNLAKLYLYGTRFEIQHDEIKNDIKKSKLKGDDLKNRIWPLLNQFDTMLTLCGECYLETRYQKYELLKKYRGHFPEEAQSERVFLENLGLKSKTYSGIHIGVNMMQGIHSWVGFEISPYSGYRPSSTMKMKNSVNDKKVNAVRSSGFFMGVFALNWRKNLNIKASEISISPLFIYAPVYINITQFGFQKFSIATKNYWFYRPEIGYSYKLISLSYAYNFMFDRPEKVKTERHLIQLKASLPLRMFFSSNMAD